MSTTTTAGGGIETTLALDQTITRFRFQYDKFYRQLRGSMERERKVLAHLADVKAQMVDNAQRLELALNARKHDESVIRTLRTELEMALQQANSSQSREAHAMSLVTQLRQEVKALTKYAHQTFSDSRQSKSEVLHQNNVPQYQQTHPHPHATSRTNAHKNDDTELMPSFLEWKQRRHIMHDHQRDHGNPEHLKAEIKRRKEHLRSPMERASQRSNRHAPPISSRRTPPIRL
jgi:hypothetical protein